jgi:hypothetical protein
MHQDRYSAPTLRRSEQIYATERTLALRTINGYGISPPCVRQRIADRRDRRQAVPRRMASPTLARPRSARETFTGRMTARHLGPRARAPRCVSFGRRPPAAVQARLGRHRLVGTGASPDDHGSDLQARFLWTSSWRRALVTPLDEH